MLGITDPAGSSWVIRQGPSLSLREVVQRRTGVGHGTVEIRPLRVEREGEIQCRAHALQRIVGQSEDIVGGDVNAVRADLIDRRDDVSLAEPALFYAVP